LRRSLTACIAEGFVTEFSGACQSASALTAWALFLGASTWMIGILGALPFLAQLAQVPAAYVTSRFGVRRVALGCLTASRQVYLALIPLPFLALGGPGGIAVLAAVAAASAAFGVMGGNAWSVWTAEIVPSSLRGRYFGRRHAICTLGAAVASLGVGGVLDGARRAGRVGLSLSALAGVVCVAGAGSAALLALLHVPRKCVAPPRLRWADAAEPLGDPRARRALAFQAAWGVATGLSGSFYALYMVRHLHVGFLGATLHAATLSIARMVAAPLWGRVVDRVGVRPVLTGCSIGLTATGLLWAIVSPSLVWILAVDALASGVLDAGHLIASMTLPIQVSPRARRPFYLAAFAMAGGISFGVASVVGGAAATALPERISLLGHEASGFGAIFLAAAALRGFGALMAMRLEEPGACAGRESRPRGEGIPVPGIEG
jgi:MFS family permease